MSLLSKSIIKISWINIYHLRILYTTQALILLENGNYTNNILLCYTKWIQTIVRTVTKVGKVFLTWYFPHQEYRSLYLLLNSWWKKKWNGLQHFWIKRIVPKSIFHFFVHVHPNCLHSPCFKVRAVAVLVPL